MSYEKLQTFVLYCRAMQEAEFDVIIVSSSPKGFGKSSFGIQLIRSYVKIFGLCCDNCGHEWIYSQKAIKEGKYGKLQLISERLFEPCPKCSSTAIHKAEEINFNTCLAYDSDEVREKIYELAPFSPILPDEGVRFMMGEDWMRYENKEMKKLFAQMRTKRLLMATNIQKFKWTDSKIRNDMTTFWIRILKRGLAILLQPDLGESEDPWHMKNFEKYLGKYFYMTSDQELMNKARKIIDKHPCAFDFFSIPKVPDRIYKEYQKIRDKKAFERKRLDEGIDQKELAKISAWNIIHRWDEIKGAVKISRFERPTYKILEEFVFSDPVKHENILRYTTIRNHVGDIDRVVKRKKYK